MKTLLNLLIVYALFSPVANADTQFNKVGEARMEYLFWDVYDATLYTPSGSYTAKQTPVKFTLTYLRDFDAKDIVKATKEQWQHLGKPQLSERYADKLLSIWPNIKKGESLTLLTDKQGHSTFFHNDNQIGRIDDAAFAEDFLAIWLSENTSEPSIRNQLLGI